MNGLKFVWAVIGGLLDSAISFLNDISSEQREIAKILDEEKEKEKRRLRVLVGVASIMIRKFMINKKIMINKNSVV